MAMSKKRKVKAIGATVMPKETHLPHSKDPAETFALASKLINEAKKMGLTTMQLREVMLDHLQNRQRLLETRPRPSKPMPAFMDAQDMAASNPGAFYAPSLETVMSVQPGQMVKVCAGSERFWVFVTERAGSSFFGIVENALHHQDLHGLDLGDVVEFGSLHVLDVRLAG